MIFGKWVSNYKDKDSILVINKDYQIFEGKLSFIKDYFTEDCNIIIDNVIYPFSNFILKCNIQDNLYYKDNVHLLYKALFEEKDKKIKQLSCNHFWSGKSENQYCKKCGLST